MGRARAKRVLLYDPNPGGHHELYIRNAADSLRECADVLAVVSDQSEMGSFGGEVVGRVSRAAAASRRASVKALREAIATFQPDAAIHLFADRDLPLLATGRDIGAPTSLLLFRPRSHYPSAFNSVLTTRERLLGQGIEWSVALWMRRTKGHSVLSLDEFAVSRWERRFGSRASWWPEPPPHAAVPIPKSRMNRDGVVLFGAITPRKGVESLCRALVLTKNVRRVTFAGPVYQGYATAFGEALKMLEGRDMEVRLENRWLSGDEIAGLLASAQAVAIPYPRHFGMSRVLLEAAAAGTPVVGTNFGLIGQQIVEYHLGLAVDASDAASIANALDAVIDKGQSSYAAGQREFVGRYAREAFDTAIRRVLSLTA